MFKKINHYLLLNHPLLWNTRIAAVLVFSVLMHALFFALGYGSNIIISDLMQYDSEIENFGTYLFAVLLLLLGLIIWLLFYLRNNAFKSFYPVNKQYLRKEFLLLFLTFIINLPVFHTFIYAKHLRLLSKTEHLNPEADRLKINMGTYFIPTNYDDFEFSMSCDSTLRRLEIEAQKPASTVDSCKSYSYNHENSQYTNPELLPSEKQYSYLYYCGYNKSDPDWRNNHLIAKRWLIGGKKDSIRWCLQNYFKVMDQYHAKYNVQIDSLVAMCFVDEKHSVNQRLEQTYNNGYPTDESVQYMSGEFDNIAVAISRLSSEREKTFLGIYEWVYYFYISFGFALVLFLFRITRLKPWLSSAIGLGIWAILFSLFNIIGHSVSEYVFLGLVFTCLVVAVNGIRWSSNKLRSALCLNWFAVSSLSILPIILFIIAENTGQIRACINDVWVITKPAAPIHHLINSNWDEIVWINLGLGFITVLYLIIPLAYRWQANPNE